MWFEYSTYFCQCSTCFLMRGCHSFGLDRTMLIVVNIVENELWAFWFKVSIVVKTSPSKPTFSSKSVPLPSKTTSFTFFHIAPKPLSMSPDKICGRWSAGATNIAYKTTRVKLFRVAPTGQICKDTTLVHVSITDWISSTMHRFVQSMTPAGR
jgi:hypothetical protein